MELSWSGASLAEWSSDTEQSFLGRGLDLLILTVLQQALCLCPSSWSSVFQPMRPRGDWHPPNKHDLAVTVTLPPSGISCLRTGVAHVNVFSQCSLLIFRLLSSVPEGGPTWCWRIMARVSQLAHLGAVAFTCGTGLIGWIDRLFDGPC